MNNKRTDARITMRKDSKKTLTLRCLIPIFAEGNEKYGSDDQGDAGSQTGGKGFIKTSTPMTTAVRGSSAPKMAVAVAPTYWLE